MFLITKNNVLRSVPLDKLLSSLPKIKRTKTSIKQTKLMDNASCVIRFLEANVKCATQNVKLQSMGTTSLLTDNSTDALMRSTLVEVVVECVKDRKTRMINLSAKNAQTPEESRSK